MLDKFIGFMKAKDNYEDDPDGGYMQDIDSEDQEYDRGRRVSSFHDDYDEESEYEEDRPGLFKARSSTRTDSRRKSGAAPRLAALSEPGKEVVIFHPSDTNEAKAVVDKLYSGQPAVLNLEGQDMAMAQRIIDFVGGANYALKGETARISNYVFLFTPRGTAITQDVPHGSVSGAPGTMNVSFDDI